MGENGHEWKILETAHHHDQQDCGEKEIFSYTSHWSMQVFSSSKLFDLQAVDHNI